MRRANNFAARGGDSVEPLALIVFAAVFVIVLRQPDAGDLGELLDRFRKAQTLELHRQREDVAFLAAAEAFEDALLIQHVEGRRLFLVERAARPVIAGRRAALAFVPS